MTGNSVEKAIPQDDMIDMNIPMELLGNLGKVMTVSYNAQTRGAKAGAEPFKVETVVPRPELSASKLTIPGGSKIKLDGKGYKGKSGIRIIWNNDYEPAIANARTNAEGAFSAEISVPNVAPGDYYLDAIDDNGEAYIIILTVEKGKDGGDDKDKDGEGGGIPLWLIIGGGVLLLLILILLGRRNKLGVLTADERGCPPGHPFFFYRNVFSLYESRYPDLHIPPPRPACLFPIDR